jgi:hypothetical protein
MDGTKVYGVGVSVIMGDEEGPKFCGTMHPEMATKQTIRLQNIIKNIKYFFIRISPSQFLQGYIRAIDIPEQEGSGCWYGLVSTLTKNSIEHCSPDTLMLPEWGTDADE